MDVKIKYQDIIDRCEKLSSFESEGKFDANGKSRYLELHINKVDVQLIKEYILQVRYILESRLSRMISYSEDFVIEDVGEEGLDTHRLFAKFVDYHDNYLYITNNEYQEELTGGEIVFMLDIPDGGEVQKGGFGYRVPISYTDGKIYTLYTNLSSLSDESGNPWVYEEGVRKGYTCESNGEQYEWNEDGTNLIVYIPPAIDIQTIEGFVWYIRTNTRWNGKNSFTRYITETIISYAMASWLKGKLDDRVPFYENLFNSSLNLAVKNIFTKQEP